MNRNRLVPVIGAAVMAATAISTPHIARAAPPSLHSHAPSISRLVLSSGDVSHVYPGHVQKLIGVAISNASEVSSLARVHLDRTLIRRSGRITGYVFEYSAGAVSIVASVDQFSSASGAGIYWNAYRRVPNISPVRGTHISQVSQKSISIGDGGRFISELIKIGAAKGTYVASVLFRQGRYVAAVLVEADLRPSESAVMSLAHAADGRIQSGG